MKKLIVFAAAAMMASPAMASKARVSALGESRQLTDVQYVFERPYLLHTIGEQVTMEWGNNTEASNPKAEGGFFKKHGEAVYGLYLGRKSADFNTAVATFNGISGGTDALQEQNPFNIFYGAKSGDLSWGVSFKYSNGKDDATDRKASSMGVSVGVTNGTWEAELVQGLSGKSEVGSDKVESKGNTKLGFGYNVSEDMHAYFNYKMAKTEAKISLPAAVDATVESTDMTLGLINTLMKNETSNVFYGVAYVSETVKDDSEETYLPVWLGVEAEATSWMVMRGSVKQNILINSNKDKASGDVEDLHSTAVAAGLGIKLGKGMLDATFTQVTGGTINSDNLLSNVSYTYMF